LERSFWRIIDFDNFRATTFFADELGRRDKEVHQKSPLRSIEIVELVGLAGLRQALIAEVLSDECPVFFFDVSVIVFVIWTRASVLDRAFTVGRKSGS